MHFLFNTSIGKIDNQGNVGYLVLDVKQSDVIGRKHQSSVEVIQMIIAYTVVLPRLIPCFFSSSESGRDNPFRPDGDISREADEIVQKIKAGQPLLESLQSPDTTDTPGSPVETSPLVKQTSIAAPLLVSPPKDEVKLADKNGSAAAPGDKSTVAGPLEIKHATVTPSEPAQVEHVVLNKKKKNCGCCVIQ